ncbi:asparagine synthetase B [Campylobacterota bacterium]|nr:asparagine synthetase B [Campylobacterota bacterium]
MCGICGIASNDPRQIPGRAAIERACDKLIARGPDGRGIYADFGAALGHQRLSVIDLQTGAQPMSDSSSRYTIVFNGEIYNYEELRSSLARQGFAFRTKSDTEVLLAGLIAHGVEFLSGANGMFAFALWDAAEKLLLLGRDRFGVKPLYYAIGANEIVFASEASAVAATNLVSRELDAHAVENFMALSYVSGEQSIYARIKRLGAGEWLRFNAGKVTRGKWWNLADEWKTAAANRAIGRSDDEWKEAFSAALSDAVKVRLKSDVPLGAFLSGGLDSATIAALMKQQSADVRTFTARFTDASYDESALAAATAAALGTTHCEDLADAGSVERLINIAQNLDEPFADTSIIPTSAICGEARRRVTVVLSGDGADELLGGYVTNEADALYAKMLRLPRSVVCAARAAVNLLPDDRKKVSAIFKLKRFFAAYPRSIEEAHGSWRLSFYPNEMQELFGREISSDPLTATIAAWNESEGLNALDRFLFVDYKTWLIDDCLVKADRASMRNSLESRAPFLDYRLFRLCAAMPPHLKRSGGLGKAILRRTAADLLPPFVLKRPKRGFNAPVAKWLCGEWLEVAKECFGAASVESAGLNPTYIAALWQAHKSGRKNYGYQLFNALILILWLRGGTGN